MNSNPAQETIREALATRVLVGDGANGTMLRQLGFAKATYDLANVLEPELVRAVHKAYFDAGSDFVETNTFAANRFRIADGNWDLHEINKKGAELAVSVCPPGRFVLGAIGPAGKHLAPIGTILPEEVFESVAAQTRALVEGGVHGIILETFSEMDEIEVSVRAVRSVTDLPLIVSKSFIEDGEALSEGLPLRVAQTMSNWEVDAIGANCVVGPQRMVDIVRQLAEGTTKPVLAFPTPGLPQLVKGAVVYDTAPEYFAKASARLVEEGARIVGGCCGTSPDHIKFLREQVDKGIAKKASQKPSAKATAAPKPLVQEPPTQLHSMLQAKQFVVTVEMDLPRGLNMQKVIEGCAALKAAGCDVVDVSDGARARLRMNPLSASVLIQQQVGIEVVMHFACRDRNLLAVQADLLGAHALGVKNILAVTGDPANIGDYPSATSVFDVDSIGLVRILSRFNEGVDLAGNSVGKKCAYTIAVAYNPLAQDMSLENDRLARKADAGAHLVYTQPIFDEEHMQIALDQCHRHGLPLFVGVLPLRSTRHAEFMHNEVPGIVIPERLRHLMANAESEEQALELGIAEAQSLSEKIKTVAQGLYLMPPFGNHGIAIRVMEAVQ